MAQAAETVQTEVKACKRCNLEKPIIEFTKSSATKSGYGSRCLLCTRECNRIRYNMKKEMTQVGKSSSTAHLTPNVCKYCSHETVPTDEPNICDQCSKIKSKIVVKPTKKCTVCEKEKESKEFCPARNVCRACMKVQMSANRHAKLLLNSTEPPTTSTTSTTSTIPSLAPTSPAPVSPPAPPPPSPVVSPIPAPPPVALPDTISCGLSSTGCLSPVASPVVSPVTSPV